MKESRNQKADAPRGRKRLRRVSVWRLLALLIVYGAFAVAGFGYYAYTVFSRDLPQDLAALKEPPSKATRVYSADGELIGEFFLERRIVVPIERIPEHVRQAFVSAEDRRFWEHPGFDLFGIVRAAYSNFQGEGSRQGASTITQQTTRLLLLSPERSYERKIKELILSVRVEHELTKRDILEIYLNRVYLGRAADESAYGVQAAAQGYFGKDVSNLSVGEAAILAGLVQTPANSPLRNLKAARRRQHYVITRMREDGFISGREAEAALSEPVTLVEDQITLNHIGAPHFVEHVRRWAMTQAQAGKLFDRNSLFRGGLNIYTTLDMRMQRSAEAAVRDGLEALDRRIGYRGPIGHLGPSQLTSFQASPPRPYLPGTDTASLSTGTDILPDVTYVATVVALPRGSKVMVNVGAESFEMERTDARQLRAWRGEKQPGEKRRPELQVGDQLPVKLAQDDKGNPVTILAQVPQVQAAMVVMDPHTGRIEAMVGGYDFRRSSFNRATQAHRQIGSAIKPFIYATALSQGTTHLSTVVDGKISVQTAGGTWSPQNYSGDFLGPVTLRTALAKSLNTVSVRLVLKYGIDPIIELIRSAGIQSPFARHISVALGTPDLTLLEVTGAYSMFPNGGMRIPGQDNTPDAPLGRFVELITAADGTVIADYRDRKPTQRVISPQLAYLMVDLMKTVVERGTARDAQALGRPAAGKTGTATNWRDAWFIGYTRDRIAGVWVGRDDSKSMGRKGTGGTAALPIWLQFMQASHPNTPVRDFEIPADITLVRANELTGEPLPAGSRSARWIPFMRGTVPARFATSVESAPFGTDAAFATQPSARKRRGKRPRKQTL